MASGVDPAKLGFLVRQSQPIHNCSEGLARVGGQVFIMNCQVVDIFQRQANAHKAFVIFPSIFQPVSVAFLFRINNTAGMANKVYGFQVQVLDA